MIAEIPLLSSIMICPLVGALYILFLLKDERLIKIIAIISSMSAFILSISLLNNFDKSFIGFQFLEFLPLIKSLNVNYQLGVDGISILYILLTTFLTPLCLLASFSSIKFRIKEYMIAFLIMEAMIIGSFVVLDVALFYILFEAMLIPMFFIIGIWGGEDRVYAAIKFFLYTLSGSLLLLGSIIYMYLKTNSFSMSELHLLAPKFPLEVQKYLWIAMFISFAIKIPMWPVHTWLPDAHVQAPTAGSVILAGILIKIGEYCFLRFLIPMLPEASQYFAPYVYVLSVIAIIYASFAALEQTNMKKMIAYSSIAHMGLITIGIFSFNQIAIEGGLMQMLGHGLISSALFLCVGVLYDRMHTKEIAKYGGVVKKMPVFAMIFLFFTFSSIGLPGTVGFVGELMLFIGSFKIVKVITIFAATSLILGAAYMLWLYKRVIFGEIIHQDVLKLEDVTLKEIAIFVPIIILTILLGFYPSLALDFFHVSVMNLLAK